MIRSATIYSAIVLAVAGAGLLAICSPDLVLEHIRGSGHWIAKIAISLFALALIACRWWTVLKQRRKPPPAIFRARLPLPLSRRRLEAHYPILLQDRLVPLHV